MTDLSLIVVTWNTRVLTLDCLATIEEALMSGVASQLPLTIQTIVVDNGSRDGTADAIRARFPWVELIELPQNRGYAAGNNAAVAKAVGRHLCLLNSDVRVEREAVEQCVGLLDERADVAVVGVQLLHEDGRRQNSIHAFPSLLGELLPTWLLELALPQRFPSKRYRHAAPIDVDAILGAAFFVRAEAVRKIGPLCEDYFFFLEETDWCWQMRRAGWRVVHHPGAHMVHLSGASSKQPHPVETRIEFHRSLYRFFARNRGAASRATVIGLRVARSALQVAALALVAPFSARQHRRLVERLPVLSWHLRGCPSRAGLRELEREQDATG